MATTHQTADNVCGICGDECDLNFNGEWFCLFCAKAPKCESCGAVGTYCLQNNGDPSVGYGGGEYWFCEECFEGRK